MTKDKDIIDELSRETKWESSHLGRLTIWLMFKLGFSKCRYCVYCNADGSQYRGMRESFLLRQGKCYWSSASVSAILTYEDLRKYHRCPAFLPILYNFKEYAINPEKVREIASIKLQSFFTWMGWIVAILIAIFKK